MSTPIACFAQITSSSGSTEDINLFTEVPTAISSPEELPWEIQFNQDFDNNGYSETTGTILLQQFNSPGGPLSFDYTFLTSESLGDTAETTTDFMIHDLFQVTLWEIDTVGERTGASTFLFGGAATNTMNGPDPYTGDFTPIDFANGGTYPGEWTVSSETTTEIGESTTGIFSQGAAAGSVNTTIPAGHWEIEFLVAHSDDYHVPSGLAIDNVTADGIANGDFENGLESWFHIGWASLFSNKNGPYPGIVDYTFLTDFGTDPAESVLPSPGGTFEDTDSNSFVGITAPDLYLIPEPSTYVMAGLGIVICGAWFLRRRKLLQEKA